MTFKVKIQGPKSGRMTGPCTFEWWEIHNWFIGNKDDNGLPFPPGWWDDLSKGAWSVLNPTKKWLADMKCNAKGKELEKEFTDTPSSTPGGLLTKQPNRWGVVVLKSGCPNGPTKRRYWFHGTDNKGKLIVWPPYVTPPGKKEPEPSPDVGDDAPAPFKGPPSKPTPRPKPPRGRPKPPKVPKVPAGAN